MKRLFSFVGAMGTVLLASAQLTSISIEPIITHDGSIEGVPAIPTHHINAILTNGRFCLRRLWREPHVHSATGEILQVGTGLKPEYHPVAALPCDR